MSSVFYFLFIYASNIFWRVKVVHIPLCSYIDFFVTLYFLVKKVVPMLKQWGTLLWRCVGEQRYSSTIFDIGSILRWVLRFRPRPLYFQYPSDRRLDRIQNQSALNGKGKHSCPFRDLNSDLLAAQPVASCYIACAIPAHLPSLVSVIIMWRTYEGNIGKLKYEIHLCNPNSHWCINFSLSF